MVFTWGQIWVNIGGGGGGGRESSQTKSAKSVKIDEKLFVDIVDGHLKLF